MDTAGNIVDPGNTVGPNAAAQIAGEGDTEEPGGLEVTGLEHSTSPGPGWQVGGFGTVHSGSVGEMDTAAVVADCGLMTEVVLVDAGPVGCLCWIVGFVHGLVVRR